MKIFQIFNSNGDNQTFCHYDMTSQFPTLESTKGRFAPDILIVEAPDYVFEGWGYDTSQIGDARFIQPPLPEPSEWTDKDGNTYKWVYDSLTGTFYIADETGRPLTPEELTKMTISMQEANE